MFKGDKLTDYEWIVEPVDKDEDIIDVIHCDTFKDTLYYLEGTEGYGKDCIRVDVAIRQRVYRYEDLDEQYYNYLEKINGLWTMAEYFPNDWGVPTDVKVPKRFSKELDAVNRNLR